MTDAKYDEIAKDYHAIIDNRSHFGTGPSVIAIASQTLVNAVGEVDKLRLLDLGCGAGELALHWAKQGADVTGTDLSTEMLKLAQAKPDANQVTWVQDDAQQLKQFDDAQFDIVASNIAMPDIPDLTAVYRAVYRILRTGGRFVFTTMHPCFQSPHSSMMEDDNKFTGRHITHYAQEGHWKSDYPYGIRGTVGAHHRTLSTYINQLLATGFSLQRIIEPTTPEPADDTPRQMMFSIVPVVMLIEVQK